MRLPLSTLPVGTRCRASSPLVGRAGFTPTSRSGPARRSVAAILSLSLIVTLLTSACSTPPRVLDVSSRTRLQTVDAADAQLFVDDRASRIKYLPQDLSAADQREEFYVRWNPGPPSSPGPAFRPGPATVNLVKFEYRQLAKPATIFEQTYDPHGEAAHLFQIRGEEFRAGGTVSAWRVSLWNGDQLLAEKQSFLW
jgi:hypothetical protein